MTWALTLPSNHIHYNASLRFIQCQPIRLAKTPPTTAETLAQCDVHAICFPSPPHYPLLRSLLLSLSPSFVNEDASFHADPVVWLEGEYPTTGAFPTYLVLFDVLEPVSDEVSLLLLLHGPVFSSVFIFALLCCFSSQQLLSFLRSYQKVCDLGYPLSSC